MKQRVNRGLAMLMVFVICISLVSGLTVSASAADYVANWGSRGTTATYLSQNAEAFYAKNDVTYDELSLLSGSSDLSAVTASELYKELQDLMVSNHSYITSYDATKEMYKYTDCQNGDYTTSGAISSFYSGKGIGPDWDGTWNREHTWPNSKGLGGSDENDIMMLRPTASAENGARGNKSYGESDGFYNPNRESGGSLNLHGDVARIALYVYVRWGNDAFMWGSDGVIESLDVLLKWMEEDPVDTWELGRNDAVESITGTRNVFVDYPELGFLLFNEVVPADMTTPSGEASTSEYTITAKANNASYGSVTVAGKNITAIPAEGYQVAGYTLESGEAVVRQNGNVFVVNASSDCTITVNFEEKQDLTVSYSENGTVVSTANVLSGDVITLPAHSGAVPTGYSFKGWVTAAVEETADIPASILDAGSTYTVNTSVTFHALYTRLDDTATSSSGIFALYSGEVTEGDYLIVFEGYAMKAEMYNSRFFYTAVTAEGNAVNNPDASLVWHIAPTNDGYWTIYNESTAQYAAGTGAKNKSKLESSVTSNSKWTPSGTSSYEFQNLQNSINEVNSYLRKNGSYGFACYSTGTGGSLTLYKAVTGTVYYTTFVVPCEHGNTTNVPAQSATCTEGGYTAGVYCNDCKVYISGHETVNAAGHSYTSVVTPPTATTEGYTTYTCSGCGDSYTGDTVPALGEGCTVTFVVPAGVELIPSMECDNSGIILPAAGVPTGDREYTFAGWTTAAVDNASEAPAAVYGAGDSYVTDTNTTLYALYTYSEGGSGESSYVLVESTDQLTVGSKVVITSSQHDIAMSTSQGSSKNNRGTAAITKNDDKTISFASDAGVAVMELRAGTVDGTYAFYCPVNNGYLYASSSSSNVLKIQGTNNANGSFKIESEGNGAWTVTAQGDKSRNILRYNNGNGIFSCYGSGQTAISLYIETVEGTNYYTTVIGTACDHAGKTEVRGAAAATCTAAGYTGDTWCTGCNVRIASGSVIPATGHADATFLAGRPSTCKANGTKGHYHCDACGKDYLVKDASATPLSAEDLQLPLDPNNHDGENEVRGASAATCTEDGYTGDTYCTGCNEKVASGNVIPAGHKLEKVGETPATHEADGNIAYYICSVCGKLYADEKAEKEITQADTVIPKGAHAYGDYQHDADKHWKECTCGSKTGEGAHTYGEWTTVKSAGIGVEGSKERSCSVCGYQQTEKLPAITNPDTGDASHIVMWMLLALTSAGAVLFVTTAKKRCQR